MTDGRIKPEIMA